MNGGFFLGSAVDYQRTSFKPGDFPETNLIAPQRAISLLSYPEGQSWPGREPQTSMSEGDGVWRGGWSTPPSCASDPLRSASMGWFPRGVGKKAHHLSHLCSDGPGLRKRPLGAILKCGRLR